MLVSATTASAQDGPAPLWAWTSGGLSLERAIETYSAYYSMRGTWWNLAATSAPDFDTSRSFAELWVHPKLDGSFMLGNETEIYGALSVGATQTLGADPLAGRDRVRLALQPRGWTEGRRSAGHGGLDHDRPRPDRQLLTVRAMSRHNHTQETQA